MLNATVMYSHRPTEKRAISHKVAVQVYADAGLEELCEFVCTLTCIISVVF